MKKKAPYVAGEKVEFIPNETSSIFVDTSKGWCEGVYVRRSTIGRTWHIIKGFEREVSVLDFPNNRIVTGKTTDHFIPANRIRRPGEKK